MKLREVATIVAIALSAYWVVTSWFIEPTCEIETTVEGMIVVETFPQSVCDEIQGRKE